VIGAVLLFFAPCERQIRALLQAEESSCSLELASVLFLRWVFIGLIYVGSVSLHDANGGIWFVTGFERRIFLPTLIYILN